MRKLGQRKSGFPTPTRRRGPSPSKTAATRRALLEAGLSAFLENGFAGTTMADVAMRAGCAKGTAYLHFQDKIALFADALREFIEDAAGRRLGRPRLGEATGDFLRRSFIPILRDLQAGDRFRVLYLVIAEGPRVPELAEVYRRIAVDPALRLARVYAARAARRGELRSRGLDQNPILLVAPMLAGAMWNNVFGRDRPIDIASLVECHLDLLFGEENPPGSRLSH
jgi:AcrR family transcriptional regulator